MPNAKKNRITLGVVAKSILVPVIIVFTAGCQTLEGSIVGNDPYIYKSFANYSGLPPDTKISFPERMPESPGARIGLIVVGTLAIYRDFDEDALESEYSTYKQSFQKYSSEDLPELSADEFARTIGGWTMIEILDIPFVTSKYLQSFVPSNVVDELHFESAFSSFMMHTTGDLVAAETNQDGALVIKTLLCQEGDGYGECASQYEIGIFDLTTGLELTFRLNPKPSTGEVIDTSNYRVILRRD